MFKPQFLVITKQKLNLFIGLLALVSSSSLAVFLVGVPTALSGQETEKESEAKTYVGYMNRAQQAYYLEFNKFASTLPELYIGINSETANYSYKIVPINAKAVQTIGLAKNPNLISYTGVVWINKVNNEETSLAKFCQSNQPTNVMPKQPTFIPRIDDKQAKIEAQCPAGYSEVN